MKTVDRFYVELGMLFQAFLDAELEDAGAARDAIHAAIKRDRADARAEPRDVLRECRAALAHCIFSPERTERLWSRMNALLADAPERTELTAEIVRNALLLVERVIPLAVIAGWTDEQQREAGEWAAAVHTQASDNDDVVVPAEPEWTKSYEVDFKGRYVRDVGAPAPERAEPSSTDLYNRLMSLDSRNDWPILRDLILEAEDTQFTLGESARLGPRLLNLAIQHRDSEDLQDACFVWSAIRTGASMLRPNEVAPLLPLLEPGHDREVRRVALKMLNRIFEAANGKPPESAADSMHLGGADYVRARARSFEGLQADCAARRDRFSFYLGHDEGFNLGLSVASVNKLVAAHAPHLEALRDATAAVRERVNEPTAMQVAEAVREACAKLYCDACFLHDVPTFDDKHNRWMHQDTTCGGNRMRVKPLAPILARLGVEPSAAGGSAGGQA